MKPVIKKVNNQIYIVDVENKPVEGDLITDGTIIQIATQKVIDLIIDGVWKVIATPNQIDIDQLFEKWLEAEAEQKSQKYNDLISEGYSPFSYERGCFQAKKETPFGESDLIKTIEVARTPKKITFDGDELTGKIIHKHLTVDEIIQQLKASKIPECEVEIKMEYFCSQYHLSINECSRCQNTGDYLNCKRLKLTEGKVTIIKLIL